MTKLKETLNLRIKETILKEQSIIYKQKMLSYAVNDNKN